MNKRLAKFLNKAFGHCILMQKSSRYKYLIFDNIELIGKREWKSASGEGSIFKSYEYYLALQHGCADNVMHRYVLVYESDIPIAASYFQVINLGGKSIRHLISDRSVLLQNSLAAVVDEKIFGINGKAKSLIVGGNLFATGELCFMSSEKSNIDKACNEFDHILRLVEDSLPENTTVSTVLMKEFSPGNLFQNKTDYSGFTSFEIDPEMLVTINPAWKTFDNYLDALASKYRLRAKNALTKSSGIVRKNFTATEIEKNKAEIETLLQMVYDKAPVKIASTSVDYFIKLKQHLNDNFQFHAYLYNKKIVAVSSAFFSNHELIAYNIGLNYSLNKSHALYQRLLYDYVNDAIALSATHLNLGRDALEIKSTVGAQPVPYKLFVRFASSFANLMAQPFAQLSQPKKWIQRNPFKETEFVKQMASQPI